LQLKKSGETRLEIKQLEIFACTVKNLSFSKAAEEMYISQPSVSACIRSLEKTLGVQLLIRNTKGVSLTKEGGDFLAYAQKILALRDQALFSVSGNDRNVRGTIDIIASTIPAQHLLPKIIASFQQSWPNTAIRVTQADSQEVEQKMGELSYDFGMLGSIRDHDRFIHKPVYDDELVLTVPATAPESPEMIRENFASYLMETPFIMRESGSGTRTEIETLFSKLGIDLRKLRTPASFSDTHSILLGVSSGIGVSLVSKIAAIMYAEAGLLKIVEMDNPMFHRQIYIMQNKERLLSPVQQAFAEHVSNFYIETKK